MLHSNRQALEGQGNSCIECTEMHLPENVYGILE